jgi:flagellar biogenesis protein FliO
VDAAVSQSPLLLLVLLGALVALPLVLRRFKAAAPDAVRVVGRTALHKSAVVAVVAVGDRRLLVGAGERGVALLAELDPAPGSSPDDLAGTPLDVAGMSATTTTASEDLVPAMLPPRRMDALGGASTSDTRGVPDVLAGLELVPDTSPVGPGIGLVDRLRAMTVRTPVQGRPLRVPLRR